MAKLLGHGTVDKVSTNQNVRDSDISLSEILR